MSQAVAYAALATALWPLRDRLDKLEKIGLLDVEPWLAWRDVRNRLAHDYPGTADLRHAAVLAAVQSAAAMLQAWAHWIAAAASNQPSTAAYTA